MQEDDLGPEPDGGTAALEVQMFAAAHEKEMLRIEIGLFGKWFGGRSEKAGNIAVLAILVAGSTILLSFISLIMLVVFLDWKTQADLGFKAIAAIVSLITLALGYVFGASSQPK